MLKALKWIIALIGLVGVGIAAYFLVQTAWDMKGLMGAIETARSREYPNPMQKIYMVAGAAAAGGLLLGLGLGMPTRTAGGIRKETLAEAERREAAELAKAERDRLEQIKVEQAKAAHEAAAQRPEEPTGIRPLAAPVDSASPDATPAPVVPPVEPQKNPEPPRV